MKEATRQFYLQAMGVTLWYPRQQLPGAAPSPDLDFSEDLPAVAASTALLAGAATPPARESSPVLAPVRQKPKEHPLAGKAPNLSGLMLDDSDKPPALRNKPVPPAVVETPPSPSPVALPEESISIYCGLWIGRRYAVFADLDGQVSLELQQRLVQNLLRALGEGKEDSPYPLRFHQVRWPVFSNPLIPGNGVEGLRVVLGSLLPCDDEHAWIVLGEETGRVVDRSIAKPCQLWLRESYRPADMASDSQLKRHLWARIQGQLGLSS